MDTVTFTNNQANILGDAIIYKCNSISIQSSTFTQSEIGFLGLYYTQDFTIDDTTFSNCKDGSAVNL